MSRIELQILYKEGDVSKLRCTVNKWKFNDAMMGEQYLTFTITSEKPIDWAVGDYCVFRGETFTLNYIPSVTQKAGTKERQDAYTYENVKFDSFLEELTRCQMLDITATTGEYVAAQGTNYTGSSKFTLFCGETVANGMTLTAVCVLAAKMQANLDRMYPTNGWKIFVDTTSTYVTGSGSVVLVTHTEDKVMSFDNWSVAQALAEVHNTFDLDYCVRGRNIYIGYNLKNLTSDNEDETFAFGYGKGYNTREDMNHGLFQIKRVANSQQQIVTRLRALGSTKNMPYRYYNKKYGLSQSLFPTNLQLPDTFATPATKAAHNEQRDQSLAHVKGDTNDAYIDKGNDAAACKEGIREASVRFDGSNSDLPEIYPTIEEATYGELRGALVQDQSGRTGSGSFPNYGDYERIDKLLAVGYYDNDVLVNDANKDNGILPESGIDINGVTRSASIGMTNLNYNTRNNGSFNYVGGVYRGAEKTLFTIQGVAPGKYGLAPTHGGVVKYGFNLSCYKDGCGCDVGYIIRVKAKNVQTGIITDIATYNSDFTDITRGSGIKEVELPELPDVKEDTPKVSQISVIALSDIIVTFTPVIKSITVPQGFTDNFSINYQVGKSRVSNESYAPEYTWFPIADSDTLTDTFHVFVQDMGFDFEACWSDDTPKMAMKSGRCVGREFEIGSDVQKVTYGGKQGYMLTLKRAQDSSLNTYYPSQTDPIAAGDHFVLLGIQMPDAYVQMAEVRLLRAATDYLADNCETKFTYQPSIDDIYLQRNLDMMREAGKEKDSIFWRLYAGLKFTFRGIPANENNPAPLAEITIEKVTISMGESLTPKVELTLNDDVQQGTIQKLTTSVDRIYNGSIFSGGSGNGATGAVSAAMLSILQSEGDKLFLSKVHDDTAAGKITFEDTVTFEESARARKGVVVGRFQSGLLGNGALIDEEGNAEFNSIFSRNFISTPEFRFNRVNVTEGENWCTNGFGTIQNVEVIDDTTGYIDLKLEENDYTSIQVGDICRGIYNDILHQYETRELDDDSELYDDEEEEDSTETTDEETVEKRTFGFSCKDGFFTSYFWVKQFITNKKGECRFLYELRNAKTPHPCEFMKFAQYGSFTNSERRSSSYSTSIGHYYEMVLDGVSTWKIHSANVVYRKGYLGNMFVTLKNGKEAQLQGYGLYVQDNVYFGNAVVQLDPETLKDIENQLKSYTIDFSEYVNVITVDDVGNVIGGLYTVSGRGASQYRQYRIQSAISVRKNDIPLIIAEDGADAGEGTYKIYVQPKGCTCVLEDSTIYITSIDNIKDGVAGSSDDTDFDYDAMREMSACSVDIVIDCEGKGSIQKSFPIRIKHDSQPYVGANIDNEFSAVSWNTKLQRYIGLPVVFNLNMWHNNEFLDVNTFAINGIPCATKAQPEKDIVVNGITLHTALVEDSNHALSARITIDSLPQDIALVNNFNITATANYSGVNYERTFTHTLHKSTDTNVYSLQPSVPEVITNKNQNAAQELSEEYVSCDVFCDSSDDKHYVVNSADYAAHKVALYYQIFYVDGTHTEETPYRGDIETDTNLSEIRFILYGLDSNGVVDKTLVHDRQGVPVLAVGVDGKGVEYIFFLQNEELPLPTIYEEADKLQNDDYCPYTDEYKTKQWTDNPSGVSEENKYEYYSMRKKIGGVWTSFGDVKEWNRYTVSPYTVEFSDHVDVITVDDAGNVIGGLYTVSGDNNEYRSYRIHSAISVRLGQDLLTIDTSNSEKASEGLYKLHVQPRGCSCVVEDSTLFITGIDNIKDGVAGTADDMNFDYDAMRQMDSCCVDITIDCEGKKTLVKSFPITIKHDSQPFIHADIDNEFSGVSWNTKTQRYIGLPITFALKMWHNDEFLNIENVNNVSLSSATDGVTLVNGTAPSTPAATSIYYTKSIETVTKNAGTSSEYSYKIARIQITAMGINVPLVTDINVTASVIYSGIPYERTLVHTINKSTDTNVYQLQPDKPTVGMTYNENKEKVLEASTVYCSVTCDSSDDNHYIVPMSDFSTHHIKVMYVITRRTDVQTLPQNYTSSGVPITTNDKKVTFYLYLLDNNGNTIDTLDIEGVDIVGDGLDGDNAVHLTIDNENDNVLCLEDGTVIASTLPKAKVWCWDGDTKVTQAVLEAQNSWGALVCTGCTAVYDGYDSEDGGRKIKVTAVSAETATVLIPCTYTTKGVSQPHQIMLSIKKDIGTDKYEIVTNPAAVCYNPNTDSFNPEEVEVSIYKTTRDTPRELMPVGDFSTSKFSLEYSKDGGTSWLTFTYGSKITKAMMNVSGVDSIQLRLREKFTKNGSAEWVVRDIEGVDIVGDGTDAAHYYLTSDINSIVKDYAGNFKGSARPTITAWKKVGDDDAVRLADIVDGTGVIAEGMTINAYEMNGNTVAYTNSSTTGTLTCATPYTYVDRFEVELVKGTKVYATISIPIIQEQQGPAGADGVFPRDRGLFKSGETYIYQKSGDIYIRDKVNYEIGGVMYGFLVLNKDTSVTAAPTSASGDSNWEAAGIVETVIANTVFGTNANIGGFMASSERLRSSSVLYRIVYKGTYNNGYYKFTTAEQESDGIPKRDMVKYGSAYFVILHQGSWTNSDGKSVSGNYIPADGTFMQPYYTDYWRRANAKEMEAVVHDSSGNDIVGGTVDFPMFELNGNKGVIRITQSEETSWFVDEDGKQTVGQEDGQRVEISPLEKKINIFDSSNKQVAQFDGDKVSTIDDLFGNSSGSLGGTDGYSGNHYEYTPSSNWHSGYVEGVVELGAFGSINGTITIVANGRITAQGNSHYSSSFYDGDPAAILIGGVPSPVQSGGSYLFKNHVIGQLVVGYYSAGKFYKVQTLAEVTAWGDYQYKDISVSKTFSGNSSRTYYLAMFYKVGLYYSTSNGGGITWSGIKVTYAGGSYLSRIFANGFVYGLNGANFMAAVAETINGTTNMHVKAMSGGGMFGFEVVKDAIYIYISGKKYKITVSGTSAVLTEQ